MHELLTASFPAQENPYRRETVRDTAFPIPCGSTVRAAATFSLPRSATVTDSVPCDGLGGDTLRQTRGGPRIQTSRTVEGFPQGTVSEGQGLSPPIPMPATVSSHMPMPSLSRLSPDRTG